MYTPRAFVETDLALLDADPFVTMVTSVDGMPFASHLPVNRASLVIVGDGALFLDALRAKHPNVEVINIDDLNLNTATLK